MTDESLTHHTPTGNPSPDLDPAAIAAGDPLRTLAGHTSWVGSAAYSPDGQFIVTASDDGTARIWDADYRDFITYACTRVSRDLTENEKDEYGIVDDTPTCETFGASNQP